MLTEMREPAAWAVLGRKNAPGNWGFIMVFCRLFPVLAAAAAVQLMTGCAVFAGTYDDGSFTITATSSQLTTTFLGASTFADSDTFANYSGSVTTPVATITGGQLNPGGSTNPDSGISSSIANYLAASSGSTETIAFNSNQKYFGMLWGSVDTTNTVSIYENNTLLASYTGSELNSSVGLQYYSAPGSFVDFVADSSAQAFNKIVLSESATFFETDNYATSAVPEASTWALMLLGFATLGFAGYRARGVAVSAE